MLLFGCRTDEEVGAGPTNSETPSATRRTITKAAAAANAAANFIEGRKPLKNGAAQQEKKQATPAAGNIARAKPERAGSHGECPSSAGIT